MSDPRTKLVAAGYDAMTDTWEDWAARITDDPRHAWAPAPLLTRVHSWLASPGWLMTAFGTGDEEEWIGDFLGAPNFFSSFEPPVNAELVKDAGFTIERDEVVSITEPEGQAQFQW